MSNCNDCDSEFLEVEDVWVHSDEDFHEYINKDRLAVSAQTNNT